MGTQNKDLEEVNLALEKNDRTIQSLESDISSLEQKIERLKIDEENTISDMSRQELEFTYRRKRMSHSLYPFISEEWADSFFDKHTDVAEKNGNINLTPATYVQLESALKQYSFRHKDGYIHIKLVANCDSIIMSKDGPRLQLSDPYGTIITEPLKIRLDHDQLSSFIGRILILSIQVHKSNVRAFHVTRIQRTKYATDGSII